MEALSSNIRIIIAPFTIKDFEYRFLFYNFVGEVPTDKMTDYTKNKKSCYGIFY